MALATPFSSQLYFLISITVLYILHRADRDAAKALRTTELLNLSNSLQRTVTLLSGIPKYSLEYLSKYSLDLEFPF